MQAYSGSTELGYFGRVDHLGCPDLMPDFGCHVYVRLSEAVGSSWNRSIYFSRLKVKSG